MEQVSTKRLKLGDGVIARNVTEPLLGKGGTDLQDDKH